MKAMILAAGLGTRLRPYSRLTPKALFTIDEKPVLASVIEKLRLSGCTAVIINTHHHHRQIEAFIACNRFGLPVQTRHEPEILGTGGGIRNVADFWGDGPLLVINADIVSNIDLAEVCAFHSAHSHPVTMVMHHHEQFNSVAVDGQGFITAFGQRKAGAADRTLAFTGIHVLDRRVLDFLPAAGPAHIIDAYRSMIDAGEGIKSFEVKGHFWYDIGTPDNYLAAVYNHMAPLAFEKAFGSSPCGPVTKNPIAGDGSDRHWFRLSDGRRTLVMAAHGIRTHAPPQEVDAYVAIGSHLAARGIHVPRLHAWDRHAGLVFLEDAGAAHLQDLIIGQNEEKIRRYYRRVIDQWIPMAASCADGFDTGWCHQTTHYDEQVILDNECRYFMEAFVNGYLEWSVAYADLQSEFEQLAGQIMGTRAMGLVHRDFQSRNIMVRKEQIYFIDFQGARLGPIQYDLASLLIDPYAELDAPMQDDLLAYAVEKLGSHIDVDRDRFISGYRLCRLSRNLQILGAFAFLSRVKGKTRFEKFIPHAAASLSRNLSCLKSPRLPKLEQLAEKINANVNQKK